MTTFIKYAARVERITYQLVFNYVGSNSGFSFDCDKDGKVELRSDAARANYEKCLANSHDRPVVRAGVVPLTHRYREPAIIRCESCEAALTLDDPMTNECGCGAFYNGSGQRLTQPSHWGEETGERFDDHGHEIL